NPALERALGYCAEELLSRPLLQFVHPDDREPTPDAVDDLSRGTAPVHFENRCRRKDETYRWLSWTAVPHGDGPRLLATATDVTDRKRLEQALSESENRYNALLRAVNGYAYTVEVVDGVPVATVHGEGCLAAAGYRPEDYQANPRLWIEMAHPEDR